MLIRTGETGSELSLSELSLSAPSGLYLDNQVLTAAIPAIMVMLLFYFIMIFISKAVQYLIVSLVYGLICRVGVRSPGGRDAIHQGFVPSIAVYAKTLFAIIGSVNASLGYIISSFWVEGPIRRELGFRTVFNILGPLTNPGSPAMQLLGVYDEYLVEPLAQVLISLGVRRGMVVYGKDKLDEISLSAPTRVCEIKDGWYKCYTITPEQFGLTRCEKADLVGGAPAENAVITRAILAGEKGQVLSMGPKRLVLTLAIRN